MKFIISIIIALLFSPNMSYAENCKVLTIYYTYEGTAHELQASEKTKDNIESLAQNYGNVAATDCTSVVGEAVNTQDSSLEYDENLRDQVDAFCAGAAAQGYTNVKLNLYGHGYYDDNLA